MFLITSEVHSVSDMPDFKASSVNTVDSYVFLISRVVKVKADFKANSVNTVYSYVFLISKVVKVKAGDLFAPQIQQPCQN